MILENQLPSVEECLRGLRQHSGTDAIWPRFLEASLRLTGGLESRVLTRNPQSGALETAARLTAGGMDTVIPAELFHEFAMAAERNGPIAGSRNGSGTFVASRIEHAPGGRAMAVVRLGEVADATCSAALSRLELACAAISAGQLNSALTDAKRETQTFADVLDLMILLDEQTAFRAAAMLLCNQLAARHSAERVSLGWLHGPYIHVEAISHSDRFEKKAEAVKALAAAMEEAVDQDDEILFPPPADSLTVSRCHAAFATAQGLAHLASVPLRIGSRVIGVITLERSEKPFVVTELRGLRLTADHAARRLEDLWRRDRWFGARLADWTKCKAGTLIGVEHTGAKLIALSVAVVLAVLVFVKTEYRVEAPFTLRSDTVAYLPAPFDGYLAQVHFRVGDNVANTKPLVALSTKELLLEESAAQAERNSFLAEAQKAESTDNIAEMQIALAKAEQAAARLERARYHLSQAVIRAPFSGIVIEGDLRERIGMPVKQGELLVKFAQLSDVYAEVKVNERNIIHVKPGAAGELAFTSQPRTKYAVRTERIEPVADATEKGNNFTVRCIAAGTPEEWWRPGMTGICKINAGDRSLLWILTHHTVEFLRMALWW